MANAINKTVEKEALDQLDQLISKLNKADEAFLSASESALKLQKNTKPNTSGGLANDIAQNKALTDEIARQKTKIDALEGAIVKLTKVRSVSNKMTAEESVNQGILNKNAIQQAKLVSNLTSEYDKLSIRLQIAIQSAKDIGAQYGSGSRQFIAAAKNVQVLDAELKKIDKSLGQNFRNVGNYTGGYNALGSSISRLAQELPNAGQSFQIFALSLGNNFAQVKDAIDGIVQRNKELKAAGEPTVSVFKQITSSVFSLNTAFYVLIAVFIAFSKQIGEFFSNAFKATNQNKALAESIKAIGEASIEGQKNAQDELVKLKANLEVAKDVNLSYKEREIAVKNLQDQYPFYFENLTKEQILAGQTTEAEKELTKALIARATALAATQKITAKQSELIDQREKLKDLENELVIAIGKSASATKAVTGVNRQRGDSEAFAAVSAAANVEVIRRKIKEQKEEIAVGDAYVQRLIAYAIGNEKVAIGLDYEIEKTKKIKQAKKENIEATDLQVKGLDTEILKLREALAAAQEFQKNFDPTNDAEIYKILEDRIKRINLQIDIYFKKFDTSPAQKQLEKEIKLWEDNKKVVEALRFEVDAFIRSIKSDFIADSGFASLNQFLDGTFQRLFYGADTLADKFAVTFNAIGEVAKDTFGFINSLGEQDFQAASERLEAQYQLSLKFAGDNVAAQEELNTRYEAKRKALARERAKEEKNTATFNAIINTASAVVAALANPGGPAGVVLAALVGLLGAAQIAIIASQPLPAYADGGTHGGGLMLVNDAKGSRYEEKVITPDGNIYSPRGRNVVMDAPRGTEIVTPQEWEYMQRTLASRGILPNSAYHAAANALHSNGGMSKSDMREVMIEAVSNIHIPPGETNVFSEYGTEKYINTRNGKYKSLNASLTNSRLNV